MKWPSLSPTHVERRSPHAPASRADEGRRVHNSHRGRIRGTTRSIMRRTWPLLVLCVAALEILSFTGGAHVSAGAPVIEGVAVAPPSLKTVPVPLPDNLADFVR